MLKCSDFCLLVQIILVSLNRIYLLNILSKSAFSASKKNKYFKILHIVLKMIKTFILK